jgi:hypothetical protein
MSARLSANTGIRQRSARLAAATLGLHGLIEMAGLFMAASFSELLQSFGGLGKSEIAANAVSIALFGGLWGLGRLVAAWGVWSLKKWAIALGILLSLATVVTALTIIPAGVSDTLLALPALALLLYAWLGDERIAP